MIVRSVSLRDIRSYERLDLDLEAGLVLVVGRNGAGKTNLLEAIHLGCQGFSPRTRADGEIIRFGQDAGRVALSGDRRGTSLELEVTLRVREGKRARLNGAPLRAAEQLRTEVAALVFTPDRLVVVKGGPAARRAYFDRALGRLAPGRAALPAEYAAAVGQRNAALRRVSLGLADREVVSPWTERVAALGTELVTARRELTAALGPRFAERAGELGLEEARIDYPGEPPSARELEARFERDLERGTTGAGPHLHDFALYSGTRDLRAFGSQGEQRTTVLALLLAEAELVSERSGSPLLLLDDVLSELDGERRRALVARITAGGQTLVTATAAAALPGEPDVLVEVEPGAARRAA